MTTSLINLAANFLIVSPVPQQVWKTKENQPAKRKKSPISLKKFVINKKYHIFALCNIV